MSGREIVDEMRSSGRIGAAPPGRRGAFDLVLIGVVVLALASVAYFGAVTWFGHGVPPAETPGPATAQPWQVKSAVVWTEQDSARCSAKARAAASENLPDEVAFANPAVTRGFARLATDIDCHLATKTERFCDPEQKALLIAAINDYLGRVDIVQLGLGLQGAPIALMGGLFGGEMAGGSAVYDNQHKETLTFMAIYHNRIAADLQRLARDGLVGPADFGGLLGGVPKNITAMFGTAVAQRNVCA